MYLNGAIMNIENNAILMPEWTSIVYVSESIYTKYENTFKKLNCKIVKVKSEENQISTIWRFFATDLTDSELILFRDCDSLITEREVVLIKHWVNSNHALHIIRDHPLHVSPIMAGLCGVRKKRIQNLLESFLKTKFIDQYGIDQWFIHKELYQKHHGDWLIHDAFYSREGATHFPTTRPNEEDYIGMRIVSEKNSKVHIEDFDNILLKSRMRKFKVIFYPLLFINNLRINLYFDIKTKLFGHRVKVKLEQIIDS